MRLRTDLLCLTFTVLLSGLHPASSEILIVTPDGTGDFPTIQAAVDAADDGDIVELTDGVFTGDGNRDIGFLGKAITLRSASGDPGLCVIDCQGTPEEPHRGLNFVLEEGSDTVVEGVTISGGYAVLPIGDEGGGVYIDTASPAFMNCVLRNNRASYGGGLYARQSGLSLVGCTFEDNEAISAEGGQGGGLFVILCGSTGWLGDCPIVDHCVFFGNHAGFAGGAVEIVLSSPVVTSCTVSHNTVGNMFHAGGIGIDSHHSQPTIENTIVSFNAYRAVDGMPDIFYVTCCDVFGNGTDWGGPLSGRLGQNGNIQEDPLFCTPDTGDFSLLDESPCAPGNHPDGAPCGLIGALPVECASSSVPGDPTRPTPFVASGPWPNPTSTGVFLELATESPSRVDVLDASGRVVRRLRDRGRVHWDGATQKGKNAPSGVYYLRIHSAGREASRTVLVLR